MKRLLLSLLLIFTFELSAQWVSNNTTNTAICDTAGEQALAKIAGVPGGGCYISWFDNRSGSYAVYLQRLDPMGNKLWANNGLLVSNNPQSSSLVDYDLKTDAAGNAMIAFTDTRNGGSLNPFAYLISPSGQFLWGANGVTLNPTTEYQANPRITQAADGNYFVAWIISTNPAKVGVQKISPAGDKLWANNLLLTGSGEGYNRPTIVPSDSNSVIIVHTAVTGNFPAQNVKLRATKVGPDGTVRWSDYLQNIGKLNAFNDPRAYSDKNGGAIVCWYDDQDSDALQESYAQRVSSSGSVFFPVNGAAVSTTSAITSTSPVATFNPVTSEMFVFYYQTNSGQTQAGMYVQKFNQAGIRQWTDDGVVVKPLTSGISYLSQQVQVADDRVMLFWIEGSSGGINSKVYADAFTFQGTRIWAQPIVVSETTQEKLQMVSYIDEFYDTKLAWGDDRGSGRGIFAQNVNKDGTLGSPVVPVELTSFSSEISGNSVILHWITATEINNKGFFIERLQNINEEFIPLVSSEWEKIGFITGNGTTNEKQIYRFLDEQPGSGRISYRIKQVDFDGSYTYYKPINVVMSINDFIPSEFSIAQNYPNPFNPETKIEYSLPVTGNISIKVFDVLGNEITTLVNEVKEAGIHTLKFNASELNSGIYFAVFTSGDKTRSIKMTLLK
ncbi:MAG: T9SS type A sorting domain-containing protein [Ignavibacteriaceae bacterium]|nr:T9SS type A sorting domain-containing protein [Ignavibacteriaceae bacterium]